MRLVVLLVLSSGWVFAEIIEQRNTTLAAVVRPQAKLAAPSHLEFTIDGTANHSIRVFHIVTPSATNRVAIFVRLVDSFDGEITYSTPGWTNGLGRSNRLSQNWTQVALSDADASEFSGRISFTLASPSSQSARPLALQWRYEIQD